MNPHHPQTGKRRHPEDIGKKVIVIYEGFLLVLLLALIVGVFMSAGDMIRALQQCFDHPHSFSVRQY